MKKIKLPGRNPDTQEKIVRQSSIKTATEVLKKMYTEVDFKDGSGLIQAMNITRTVAEDIERWVDRKVDPRENND